MAQYIEIEVPDSFDDEQDTTFEAVGSVSFVHYLRGPTAARISRIEVGTRRATRSCNICGLPQAV
jgi:hypothetical protein